MEVLKIATAGSVDDGKSTLIGRILYDTKSLTSDKLKAIEDKSEQLGYDYLDFSLATDGLMAEREQGITIDVAHIYFFQLKRKVTLLQILQATWSIHVTWLQEHLHLRRLLF